MVKFRKKIFQVQNLVSKKWSGIGWKNKDPPPPKLNGWTLHVSMNGLLKIWITKMLKTHCKFPFSLIWWKICLLPYYIRYNWLHFYNKKIIMPHWFYWSCYEFFYVLLKKFRLVLTIIKYFELKTTFWHLKISWKARQNDYNS